MDPKSGMTPPIMGKFVIWPGLGIKTVMVNLDSKLQSNKHKKIFPKPN